MYLPQISFAEKIFRALAYLLISVQQQKKLLEGNLPHYNDALLMLIIVN